MTISRLARLAGARIEIADLGDWSGSELFAEYDPHGAVIRINARCVQALHGFPRRRFIVHAVAHELYHHFERIGTLPRAGSRTARERAAERFASAALR